MACTGYIRHGEELRIEGNTGSTVGTQEVEVGGGIDVTRDIDFVGYLDGIGGEVEVTHGDITLYDNGTSDGAVTTNNKCLTDILVTFNGNVSADIEVSTDTDVLLKGGVTTDDEGISDDHVTGYGLVRGGYISDA